MICTYKKGLSIYSFSFLWRGGKRNKLKRLFPCCKTCAFLDPQLRSFIETRLFTLFIFLIRDRIYFREYLIGRYPWRSIPITGVYRPEWKDEDISFVEGDPLLIHDMIAARIQCCNPHKVFLGKTNKRWKSFTNAYCFFVTVDYFRVRWRRINVESLNLLKERNISYSYFLYIV